ncbi:patatin-like phospholipase family protein [Hyalangium versicolor]|uniref:patatin-like phospholipase family protein n=1 Tax=Hyalangium versicolor TaxID=2861190 RepID=UPI001CC9959E|nr:patatin-like phospholipase family protein [Hyalangium versicolor]
MNTQKSRILSMDGGGPLSIISLVLLKRLLKKEPQLLRYVDVFAGNSAGAINALMLASRDLSPGYAQAVLDQLIEFWAEHFIELTANNLVQNLGALAGARPLGQTESLETYLRNYFFQDTPLANIKNVAITTFQLDSDNRSINIPGGPVDSQVRSWMPRVLHNFKYTHPERLRAPLVEHKMAAFSPRATVLDAAMASSAPPIMFPVYKGHLDGAMFANNPAMCALSQVIHFKLNNLEAAESTDVLKNTTILSLGTGQNPMYVETSEAFTPWGYREWLLDLRHPLLVIQALYEANMLTVDFQCINLLGHDRYVRINPPLQRPVEHNTDYSITVAVALDSAKSVTDAQLDSYLARMKASGWFDAPAAQASGLAVDTAVKVATNYPL